MKKKLMITGSFPPDYCGVGDYVACFMAAHSVNSWRLYYSEKWSVHFLFKKIREINSYHTGAIYMQYPTQGYGWSLLPQMLCIYYSLFTNKTFVTVLHEFSQRNFKARLATALLLLSNKVVFTNDFERNYVIRLFPFLHKRFSTIKILSNIKPAIKQKDWSNRKYDLMYFGHIRPCKGLEDVFNISILLQEGIKLRIAVVGQVLPEFESYFDCLKKVNASADFDYFLNKDADLVSSLLNDAKFVFLPFPDGVSERRGSFLAAIANGALVVTYDGKFVTSALKKICFLTSPDTAFIDLKNLLDEMNEETYAKKQLLQKDYFLRELPHSWDNIVESYDELVDSYDS